MPSPESSRILATQLRELVSLYLARQRRHAHEQGLAQTDRLLMLLRRYGAVSQTEFGRLAGLEKSWVSRIVERYVEDGLLERKPLATDRRCLELHLTPAGEARAADIDRVLTDHAEAFFKTVPAASHESLQTALAGIIDALQQPPQEGF